MSATKHIAERMAALGITLPDGCEIDIRPSTSRSLKAVIYTKATLAYGTDAGEMSGFPSDKEMTDKTIREIARFARKCNDNWASISSIDHFLDITSKGLPLAEVGLDVAFVKWCESQDVGFDDIVNMMRRWHRTNRLYNDVLEGVRRSWTNMEPDLLRSYFPRAYRNMNYIYDQTSCRLDFFQGCFWGRKPFAFDFMLGNQRYQSSSSPTLVIEAPLPEAGWKSLKGRHVNDIVSKPIFGDSQKVLSVQDHGSYRTLTMSGEIIPLVKAPDLAMAA